MKNLRKGVLHLLSILSLFILLTGHSGCDVVVDDGYVDYGYTYEYTSTSYEQVDITDELVVMGSGDVLNLEYNNLAFSALFDYDNGLYFFAPDPDGYITGDPIVCAAAIDDMRVQGDCFRLGRVCHFDFAYDSYASDPDHDVYYLAESTCRQGGDVGPFLVPLESPLCGEDPFPPCPTDAMFPSDLPPAP